MRKQPIMSVLLTLLLTACGSSSSGNGNKMPNTDNSNGKKPISQPAQQKPVKKEVTGIKVQAVIDVKNKIGGIDKITTIADIGEGSTNRLKLNGKIIDLMPKNYALRDIYEFFTIPNNDGVRRMVSGSYYKNVRFGIVGTGDDNRKDYTAFSQGINPTKELPITGKAFYRGDIVTYFPGQSTYNDDGTIILVTDFANKGVIASINHHTHSEEKILAGLGVIKGNSFTLTKTDGDQKLQGRFYGTNGQEVSGVYTQNSYDDVYNNKQPAIIAAFGGIKQEILTDDDKKQMETIQNKGTDLMIQAAAREKLLKEQEKK